MGQLDGKTAIVTGGAEGIGVAYAKALAAEGAKVAIWDVVSPESTVAAIRTGGGEALGLTCDVSDPAQIGDALIATQESFGKVHILVNNAAVFARLYQKPFEEISTAEFDKALAVNVRGPFECVKALSPLMRAQKYGKIVNIASGTAFKGTAGMMHYVASKGAVISMTRSMANELGRDGINVNCIAPGLVMTEAILAREGMEDFRQGSAAGRFLRKPQTPEDLTGTLVFLASPASDFITGQIIVVDGGAAMH
ncbi:MAG: glucose 1-dehydrogenase [Hyphomicrobiales bacterium]|nr:glucose 1-dehydrogenase [Hyphomicrobiales bacterium]